jgi:hypothetical protein
MVNELMKASGQPRRLSSNVASEAGKGGEVPQALTQGDLFLIHLQGAQTGAHGAP